MPSTKDDQGNYLIDRDGDIFRHVLKYLRCGKLILPDGFNELRLIECEADFFSLPSLKESVSEMLGEDSPNQKIGLNVGGKIYTTTRATLTSDPDSFFCAMLKGETETPLDEYGNYLIDRDGEIFRDVLNYLQRGNLVVPYHDWYKNGELACEARYFKLPALQEQSLLLYDFKWHYQNSRYTPSIRTCTYSVHGQ